MMKVACSTKGRNDITLLRISVDDRVTIALHSQLQRCVLKKCAHSLRLSNQGSTTTEDHCSMNLSIGLIRASIEATCTHLSSKRSSWSDLAADLGQTTSDRTYHSVLACKTCQVKASSSTLIGLIIGTNSHHKRNTH